MDLSNVILKVSDLTTEITDKKLFSKKEELYPVENLNLTIHHGEFTALIGESGCGKSVTALSILNLLPENLHIKSGSIKYKNIELTSLSKKEYRKLLGKEIASIFQDPMSCLNPLKKAGKQIEEAAVKHGMPKKEAKEEVLNILKLTGFEKPEEIAECYPHELSGGMMQRILIAMALINKPSLLIADEPTTALDVTVQKEILDLLFNLNRKLNLSVLLISHDLGIVSNVCSSVNVMYAGQIVESGSTQEILQSPSHPYTKALLSAIPDLRNKDRKLTVVTGTVPQLNERSSMCCRFYDRCTIRQNENISEKCSAYKQELKNISENHKVRCSLYADKENI